MTQFDKKAVDLLKEAVYKGQPYLVITLDGEKATNAYSGSERFLIEAIHASLNRNKELREMVTRALNKSTDFVQSSQTLTLN